jgi:hypothetical protein
LDDEPWFPKWLDRHSLTFNLTSDRELLTLAEWEKIFAAGDYSAAELHDATGFIAQNPHVLDTKKPKMERHLIALMSRLRARRANAPKRPEPSFEDKGTCTLCGGSSCVVVPHLRGISEGRWVPIPGGAGPRYYTFAVACSCFLGRRKNEHRDPRLLSLEEYQARNPDWRAQLKAHDEELLALGEYLGLKAHDDAAGVKADMSEVWTEWRARDKAQAAANERQVKEWRNGDL